LKRKRLKISDIAIRFQYYEINYETNIDVASLESVKTDHYIDGDRMVSKYS